MPDLRANVMALTIREPAAIATRDAAARVESRLALYRELVPRLERLGAELEV